MNIAELINDENASLVDVRTVEEFNEGHVEGSINIPLDQVPNRVEEFESMSRPLILFCRSGGRSGQAQMFLSQTGMEEVYNGGGWQDVNAMIEK